MAAASWLPPCLHPNIASRRYPQHQQPALRDDSVISRVLLRCDGFHRPHRAADVAAACCLPSDDRVALALSSRVRLRCVTWLWRAFRVRVAGRSDAAARARDAPPIVRMSADTTAPSLPLMPLSPGVLARACRHHLPCGACAGEIRSGSAACSQMASLVAKGTHG